MGVLTSGEVIRLSTVSGGFDSRHARQKGINNMYDDLIKKVDISKKIERGIYQFRKLVGREPDTVEIDIIDKIIRKVYEN